MFGAGDGSSCGGWGGMQWCTILVVKNVSIPHCPSPLQLSSTLPHHVSSFPLCMPPSHPGRPCTTTSRRVVPSTQTHCHSDITPRKLQEEKMGSVNNRGSEESSTGSVNGVVACTGYLWGRECGEKKVGKRREEKRRGQGAGVSVSWWYNYVFRE